MSSKSFKSIIFRNSRSTWRITWSIGIAILVLRHVFGFHFFYIYYYFFAVGLIPLFNSLFRYAVIEETGLTLYYGTIFIRDSLKISWDKFQRAELSSYSKSYMSTVGIRVRLPVKMVEEKQAVLLILKNPLPDTIRAELNNGTERIVTKQGFELSNSGTEILLKYPPEGGFKNFLSSIAHFIPTSQEASNFLVFNLAYRLIYLLNAVIIFLAIFLGIIL